MFRLALLVLLVPLAGAQVYPVEPIAVVSNDVPSVEPNLDIGTWTFDWSWPCESALAFANEDAITVVFEEPGGDGIIVSGALSQVINAQPCYNGASMLNDTWRFNVEANTNAAAGLHVVDFGAEPHPSGYLMATPLAEPVPSNWTAEVVVLPDGAIALLVAKTTLPGPAPYKLDLEVTSYSNAPGRVLFEAEIPLEPGSIELDRGETRAVQLLLDPPSTKSQTQTITVTLEIDGEPHMSIPFNVLLGASGLDRVTPLPIPLLLAALAMALVLRR